ncbi:hypothetical protein EV179_004001 [Coemansia sp. RSA 487]|nr:hypothetical protein EV179_004001 [Coemansia sp. RSA 487]
MAEQGATHGPLPTIPEIGYEYFAIKWPRIILMAFAVLTAIVPAGSYLVIPTHDLGIESFCHLPIVYTLEQYTYNMLTIALWQYLSGVVGVVSVTIIGIHILWTRRRAQHVLARSIYSSGYSRDVVEQSRSNILHSTMLNIIWYPITPIISLWLNIILISVAYYKQRTYMAAEFINVALLGLQSVFLGVALILNPNIREAFNKNAKVKWRYSRERKTSRARGPDDAHTQQEPPRPEILSTGSLDGTDSTLSALDNV